ncbi:hypothetical protein [Bradyrhizobium sp. 76]|nr:hypothetical protein [Bradyrhizobium sp. 76]
MQAMKYAARGEAGTQTGYGRSAGDLARYMIELRQGRYERPDR